MPQVPCRNFSDCRFFNVTMKGKPGILATGYLKQYCEVGNPNCARLVVSQRLGGGTVPDDLAPHELSRAMDLLRRAEMRTSCGVE